MARGKVSASPIFFSPLLPLTNHAGRASFKLFRRAPGKSSFSFLKGPRCCRERNYCPRQSKRFPVIRRLTIIVSSALTLPGAR